MLLKLVLNTESTMYSINMKFHLPCFARSANFYGTLVWGTFENRKASTPFLITTPTFAGTVTLCTLCLSIAYEVFHNHVLGKHLVNSFNWLWRGFFSFPEGALMKSLIRKPLSHQLPQVFEKYLMLTFNHFTLFAW